MSCLFAGFNCYHHLAPDSNNVSIEGGFPILSPPVETYVKPDSLLSISTYFEHTVWVSKNGQGSARGNNSGCRISGAILQDELRSSVELDIISPYGKSCRLISAVCGTKYTLYLVRPLEKKKLPQLCYITENKNGNAPFFVPNGGKEPKYLFGGSEHCAAIDSSGSIHIISSNFFDLDSPVAHIKNIPDNEVPISVCFCNNFIYALSQNGHLFTSKINSNEVFEFQKVEELNQIEIVSISGTHQHCFAVSTDGVVYSKGSNQFGQLGLGTTNNEVEIFTAIDSLKPHKIIAAYAGADHSIFQTKEGKLFACGNNNYGQLILPPSNKNECTPIETSITENATFVIAGNSVTGIFIGCQPPPNCPNKETIRKIEPTIKPMADKPTNEIKPVTTETKSDSEVEQLKQQLKEANDYIQRLLLCINESHIVLASKEQELEQMRNVNCQLFQKNLELSEQLEKFGTHPQLREFRSSDIDKYKIIKSIGTGTISEVVEVTRNENFALKILDTKLFENDFDTNEKLKIVFDDFERINELNHPNILKCYGYFYGDENHPPSLLFEICHSNLNMNITKLTACEQISIIFEIADAMRLIHASGVIHRNLKPENILLNENNYAKVSDFGISKLISTDYQTKSGRQPLHSIQFVAPELLLRERDYTEKIDVYAFGVLVYFILTKGKYPNISIIDVGNGKTAEIPKTINAFSTQLIQQCWEFQPNKRPSFAEIYQRIQQNEFRLIDGLDKELIEIKSRANLLK